MHSWGPVTYTVGQQSVGYLCVKHHLPHPRDT
jgi:hypothetical protein